MPRTTAPTIREFMTPAPYSIAPDRPLAVAHELMRQHRIRHLPVVKAGRLVGMITQRDLHLIETLRDVDPQTVDVSEAMSTDPFTVSPTSLLEKVAAQMWAKKLGSAVVVEGREVVGVFTTIDALGALITLLARGRRPSRAVRTPTSKRPRSVARRR